MSYLYDMGLRGPSCNGCSYLEYKWKLGDKFLALSSGGWVDVYELDAGPRPGQGEPKENNGRPIRFKSGFSGIGHSDECWGFKVPDYPYVPPVHHDPEKTWKTGEGHIIPIEDLETRHLINILKLCDRKGVKPPGFGALRKEARGREILLATGEETTVDELIFPKEGIVQRIKELIQ